MPLTFMINQINALRDCLICLYKIQAKSFLIKFPWVREKTKKLA